MPAMQTCRICPLVDVILKMLLTLKSTFKSKKNDKTFQEEVIDIKNKNMSFDDLKTQFTEENPTWKEALISVPTVLLLKYMKKVPYYVTEDDVRTYLNGEFKRAMQLKKESLCSSKITSVVEDVFDKLKAEEMSLEEAIEQLNDKGVFKYYISRFSEILTPLSPPCKHVSGHFDPPSPPNSLM